MYDSAIELGETVVDGIYRELSEEVNLDPQHANLSLPFHATDFIDIDNEV
jgi:ADP-ribose pyrophosphatase YjhB (NUDIX family)